jgi:catechol 2,3-dioxygenase-like lactoylglutathione lyase family enzyme
MRWLIFAVLAACFLIGVRSGKSNQEQTMLTKIDHLVYATPDLAAGVKRVEELLGVKAVDGGQHPGAGTRNALIGLGDGVYLEIIGPDPSQPKPNRARRFGIDELRAPRLVTWAAKGTDLEGIVKDAKRHGLDLGPVQFGSRRRPDGVLLAWRLTVAPELNSGGIVPFFIDWGETPHPASTLPKGCTIVALRAEHPDVNRVQAELSALGLNLRVDKGAAPALIATIRTAHGDVELR